MLIGGVAERETFIVLHARVEEKDARELESEGIMKYCKYILK